jgi:glutamine amidotransferase
MRSKVIILDYSLGNLHSVANAVRSLGHEPIISSEPDQILSASHLILPGVGAFERAMQRITERHLLEVIKEFAFSGKPLLGICLGMQLLFQISYEFKVTAGIGLLNGEVVSLPFASDEKLPNIGWRTLFTIKKTDGTLFDTHKRGSYFYFAHSFMASKLNPSDIVGIFNYGDHQIVATVQRENIFGCQFHPEKSGQDGLNILENFLKK